MKLIVAVFLAACLAHAGARATAPGASPCRCVPDQWEGALDTVEREFELADGQVYEAKNKVVVHYDYADRKFATVDAATGRRSIADYRSGVKATVHGSRCRAVQSTEAMRRMCFPEGANIVATSTLGSGLEVNTWNFLEPQNATVTTTATKDRCIPIFEEITITDKDYLSLSSTLYTDITLGIKDSRVFEIPKDCVYVDIPDAIRPDSYNLRKKRTLLNV